MQDGSAPRRGMMRTSCWKLVGFAAIKLDSVAEAGWAPGQTSGRITGLLSRPLGPTPPSISGEMPLILSPVTLSCTGFEAEYSGDLLQVISGLSAGMMKEAFLSL